MSAKMSRARAKMLREDMQNSLMSAMQVAFAGFGEHEVNSPEWIMLDKQFRRVEKLFGYQEGSWGRGV